VSRALNFSPAYATELAGRKCSERMDPENESLLIRMPWDFLRALPPVAPSSWHDSRKSRSMWQSYNEPSRVGKTRRANMSFSRMAIVRDDDFASPFALILRRGSCLFT